MTDEPAPYHASDDLLPSDFVDALEDMRWECVRCGLCCHDHFGKGWLEPFVIPSTGPPIGDHCRFYSETDRICTIHDHRPLVCRDHPFILTKRDGVHRLQIHSRCPGIGCGGGIYVRNVVGSLLDHIRELYDMDFMVDWSELSMGRMGIYRIK